MPAEEAPPLPDEELLESGGCFALRAGVERGYEVLIQRFVHDAGAVRCNEEKKI